MHDFSTGDLKIHMRASGRTGQIWRAWDRESMAMLYHHGSAWPLFSASRVTIWWEDVRRFAIPVSCFNTILSLHSTLHIHLLNVAP